MSNPLSRLVGPLLALVVLIALAAGAFAANQYYVFGPTPPLMTAATHPIQYHLSLPEGWNPRQTWPILVSIDGSDKDFARLARLFQRARGGRPYIIVTPLVVSNGPRYAPQHYHYSSSVWKEIQDAPNGYVAFDEAGILAVVSEVRRRYSGEGRFYMTGWSAGGRITWVMILKHPEMLGGAVLAAANYGNGTDTFSSAPERASLPIKGLQGTADNGLASANAQWAQGVAVAREHDYPNISRDMISGAPHSPFPDQTYAFLDGLRQRG